MVEDELGVNNIPQSGLNITPNVGEERTFDGEIPSALSSPSRAGSMTPWDRGGRGGAPSPPLSQGGAADEDDDDKSAGSAASISQLLQQGQNAGKYAQTLRSILRTMDKEDSSVQLESLEQVLKLGHAIALQEKASETGAGASRPPRPPLSTATTPGDGSGGGRPPFPTHSKRRSPSRALSPAPTSIPAAPVSASANDKRMRRSRAGIALSPHQGQDRGAPASRSHRGPPPSASSSSYSLSRPGSTKPHPKKWSPASSWDSNVRVISPAPGSARKAALGMTTPRADYPSLSLSAERTPGPAYAGGGGRTVASRTTPRNVPGTANIKRPTADKRVFGHRV